ncbi:MAG TPA: alpha/beta hydrolase [Planctomycetota bacterium]|nr:alpha/beta hydrolase [Planctomycetota bacterium]
MIRALKISLLFLSLALCLVARAGELPPYKTELGIVYGVVDGKELKLNAFMPANAAKPTACMVDIHGGWWHSGAPTTKIEDGWYWKDPFMAHSIAIISIQYRLGKEGGFPESIRDCRNAIRFIRKNATRFNIDPDRIGCMGGSAGGHLSAMLAMVPEDFNDGGPLEDLKGVSAKVQNAFSFVGPTDFVRQWNEAPDDVLPDGSFRPADNKIPHDARPRHRVLFKGVTPNTPENEALYRKMSPIGHVRKDISPLLICDGERDAVVPYHHGKYLAEKLKAAGADVTYWMTMQGGHSFPGGPGFSKVLEDFLVRTLKLEK